MFHRVIKIQRGYKELTVKVGRKRKQDYGTTAGYQAAFSISTRAAEQGA